MAYTAEQRQQAVAIVESHDWIINDAVLSLVRVTLNIDVSQRSLYNWCTATKKSGDPAPAHSAKSPEKVSAKTLAKPANVEIEIATESPDAALVSELRVAAHKFIARAVEDERMEGMRSDRLMTAAGIAIDKILKLEGIPDFVIAVTINLVEVAQQKGLDPARAIEAMIDQMRKLPDKEMITSGSGVN